MANDLLNPPENEGTNAGAEAGNGNASGHVTGAPGHELDALMGRAFDSPPVWKELYNNLLDAFFPPKLPPLELTSTPIPVKDPLAVKRSPVSVAISAGINVGILLLFVYGFRHQIAAALPPKLLDLGQVDIAPWKPMTKKSGDMGGGGGGGAHDVVDAIKGRPPKIEKNPILQPQVAVNDHPKLAVDPALDIQEVKLPDNPLMPNFGVAKSPNVTLASNGQGNNGIGTGKGGGLGSGNGNGYGPGEGGNLGGGLRHVGDGVSAPVLVNKVEAEFSDEARRAKYEGTVVVSLIVDANGNPQNVHVVRHLGMGLDEKAIEAVQKYKFKPSIDQKTHQPVPVPVNVEVRFRLY